MIVTYDSSDWLRIRTEPSHPECAKKRQWKRIFYGGGGVVNTDLRMHTLGMSPANASHAHSAQKEKST
jgi:hypothetical protein